MHSTTSRLMNAQKLEGALIHMAVPKVANTHHPNRGHRKEKYMCDVI